MAKQKNLKTLWIVIGIVGGIILFLIIISLTSWYVYKKYAQPTPISTNINTNQTQNQNQSQNQNKTQNKSQNTSTSAVNYDGTYSGSSPIESGLASGTVTVSGGKITGHGTYIGLYGAQININITGTVDAFGNFSGSFSGSGEVDGVPVTGSGTYSGKITGNIASVNYTATGSGGGQTETHSGTIDLTKQ